MCERIERACCRSDRRRQGQAPSRRIRVSVALFALAVAAAPFCTAFTIHTPYSQQRSSSNVVLSAQRRAGRTRPAAAQAAAQRQRSANNKVTSIRPDSWEPVARKQRNVNKQFKSRHAQYEEERLHGRATEPASFVPLKSDETKLPTKVERQHLTEKIALLLNENEEEDENDNSCLDDVADRQAVFFKLSDEDKNQASFAVSKMSNTRQTLPKEPSLKTGTKITANVLETGQDTMKQYVKSMGQHQVLSAEDESVLGRQIQILNGYEEERQKLEETLLRYVLLCM